MVEKRTQATSVNKLMGFTPDLTLGGPEAVAGAR